MKQILKIWASSLLIMAIATVVFLGKYWAIEFIGKDTLSFQMLGLACFAIANSITIAAIRYSLIN